ncbi:MAG: MBL fold metallo-hydrolase [Candidatus Caldatribacteriota bacterium]|nr:MBL fold metallo-hydrolase [Atribacterota bacterium]MDD3031879.1 MBL fold metallo-hydrolase [Atribacterota bacterium]MDD3641679.1 MBL fold metallo-hydrolase [Atribacterota bacterium]MDD4288113.1 MBL fold metallo-hydrolase [Atribacterota bacterium]MDD4764858.1 MBL fold metallo-hydrolase [Atribacterota bacterium]
MKIHFLGAAQVVTGSNMLLETENRKILLDCGMFQGNRQLNSLNYKEFPFNPEEVEMLILSHAHIDHSGRIPSLIKKGFKKKIYCTKATYDLCSIMLPDSGYVQETENEWENRKRKRAGKPLREPLYTAAEATDSLKYFSPVLYNQKITIDDNLTIRFQDAGHILGSSIVEMWIKEKGETIKLVFTGDLGRKNKPIIRNPSIIEEADYLIMESTYGNRKHASLDNEASQLIPIMIETKKKGGNVIIPSFAVQRAQDIIYELNQYYDQIVSTKDNSYLDIPVYVDSPLTISATEIFRRNPDCFDKETLELIQNGYNPLDFKNLHFTRTAKESKQLNISSESKVIISASGMCTAGRIKHHLKHNLWRKESSVVFVGYQAEGTLGRRIKDGAKKVKIFGEDVKVNAQIHVLEGFSGHADKDELIEWLKNFKKKPQKVFLVHGEKDSLNALQDAIQDELGLDVTAPELGDHFLIQGVAKTPSLEGKQEKGVRDSLLLEEETSYLKDLMESVLDQLEEKTKQDLEEEDMHRLKNKILELKKEGIELSMMMTDKNKTNHQNK